MSRIKTILKYIVYNFFTLFPIKKNKIICNNFMGKGFGDNPKYIVNELIKQKVDCDIVWVCKHKYAASLPENVRIITKWYGILYEFATSKIWISNIRLPRYLRKRKKQFYIQTWHGGIGLKKVEKDVINSLSKGYVKDAIYDAKQTDLMIANCDFIKNLYLNSFWYNGPVFCDGLPKHDLLLQKDIIKNEMIIKKYNLDGYNLLLYAPTFRKEMTSEVYNIDFKALINTLNKKTNKKWKIIVKLHPGISSPEKYINFNKDVLNLSEQDDINDLYSISDILISDYSSTIFDFMLTMKPVFIFATDIDEYKKDRDFYFDLKELPFAIATNNKQLMENIKSHENNDMIKKYNSFNKKYGVNSTSNSSEKIVEIIKEKIN